MVKVPHKVVRVHLNPTRVHHPGLGFEGFWVRVLEVCRDLEIPNEGLKFLVELQSKIGVYWWF